MLKKTLLLLSLATSVVAVAASTAAATAPQPLTLAVSGMLTGPNSIVGTWRATGLFTGSGTYVEDFRFAGNSIHVVKTLTSPEGTFVLKARALYSIAPDGTVTFAAGSWQIVDGTGAYEGLHAGGQPATQPGSYGSLATGQVHVIHVGDGHFE